MSTHVLVTENDKATLSFVGCSSGSREHSCSDRLGLRDPHTGADRVFSVSSDSDSTSAAVHQSQVTKAEFHRVSSKVLAVCTREHPALKEETESDEEAVVETGSDEATPSSNDDD